MTKETLEFNPHTTVELKDAYNLALKKGEEVFLYKGHEFFAPYAGYLIDYLEQKFGVGGKV